MGRLVTERSKEVASIASGAGLPSASGCKDPMYQDLLSPLCSWTMFRSICLPNLIDRFPIGAHPRSRGENNGPVPLPSPPLGSSPLMRGKRRRLQVAGIVPGLIPTHAGKTRGRRRRSCRGWTHPRLRGENRAEKAHPVFQKGSSPLTRGKREFDFRAGLAERLIPTHAGKTTNRGARATGTRAHPHSRGENPRSISRSGSQVGSSPLMRGKPCLP